MTVVAGRGSVVRVGVAKVAQSRLTLCDPMKYTVRGILQIRILEWVSLSLLQGSLPTQGSNTGLPCCRQILYQVSHKGSLGIRREVFYFAVSFYWLVDALGLHCCVDFLQPQGAGVSLWSTGSRRFTSVVAPCGPSCSVACGIFPDQGSN